MGADTKTLSILHILTLWSEAGEYGGPSTVARNLAAQLAQQGHRVAVVAGTRDSAPSRVRLDGFELILFPVKAPVPSLGFAGLCSPRMIAWILRNWRDWDVFHVHLARDLVSMVAARLVLNKGRVLVCQTHGMIDESDRPSAGIFDKLFTRSVLASAQKVLALTENERGDLVTVGAPAKSISVVPNGVPLKPVVVPDEETLHPATTPLVVFVSRLHSRKQPVVFAEAAENLIAEGVDVRFVLAGPDEGEGGRVSEVIARVNDPARLSWIGAVKTNSVGALLGEAFLLVLPSVDEPYPMIILEALASETPVVITDSCGLANFVSENDAGIVSQPDCESIRASIATLLADPERASAMGLRGRWAVFEHRGQVAITDDVRRIYQSAYSELSCLGGD